jgi:hypothetical protein
VRGTYCASASLAREQAVRLLDQETPSAARLNGQHPHRKEVRAPLDLVDHHQVRAQPALPPADEIEAP